MCCLFHLSKLDFWLLSDLQSLINEVFCIYKVSCTYTFLKVIITVEIRNAEKYVFFFKKMEIITEHFSCYIISYLDFYWLPLLYDLYAFLWLKNNFQLINLSVIKSKGRNILPYPYLLSGGLNRKASQKKDQI